MIISVINFTNGKIMDEEVHAAVRAINRQIAEDFEPYWSFAAPARSPANPRRGADRPALKMTCYAFHDLRHVTA